MVAGRCVGRGLIAVAVLAMAVAVGWVGARAVPPASGSTVPAGTGTSTWTGVAVALPHGGKFGELASVACATASACTAVGEYSDLRHGLAGWGLVLTGSGSSWHAARLPLPKGAPSPANITLTSVACPAAGACVAAGEYQIAPYKGYRLVVLTEHGSSWRATSLAKPPLNASGIQPAGIACRSVRVCVAPAGWVSSRGRSSAVVLVKDGATWQENRVPMPAGWLDPALYAVACHARGVCVLAGSYLDSRRHNRSFGLLLTLSGSGWTVTSAPLPPGANLALGGNMSAVTCPATATCVVAGAYFIGTFSRPVLLTGSGRSWSEAVAQLPADADAYEPASMNVIGCATPNSCTAAGSYYAPICPGAQQSPQDGLLVSGGGSSWKAVEAPTATSDACAETVSYTGAACPAAGHCVILAPDGVLTGFGTSWLFAKNPLPSSSAGSHGPTAVSLTCPAAQDCIGAANYTKRFIFYPEILTGSPFPP